MSDFADITPSTHLLHSLRKSRMKVPALLGEAIDNAFDADARTVKVTVADDAIIVEDDGRGVPVCRWKALFGLGHHERQDTTALGRYGVGIKNQSIAAGDLFRVSSVSEDGEFLLQVDWETIERSGKWLIPEPTWLVPSARPKGTKIYIGRLHRPPTAKEIERARNEVAQLFYPAIALGASILFNGSAIEPVRDPLLTEVVETRRDFGEGKRAFIRAGFVSDPNSKIQGVDLSFKHRVIKPRSAFGCGDYSPTGMFARVYLSGDWTLSKYKDELNDIEHGAALEDAVFDVLAPFLERCKSATLSVRFREMKEMLNASLPIEMAAVRPRKEKDLGRQGKKKKRVGKAPDAPESPTGPALGGRTRSGLMIDWEPGSDQWGYGRFEKGKISRIWLARDNPHIAELMSRRDRESARRELYLIAMAVFLGSPQQLELELDGGFGLRLWKLFEQQGLSLRDSEAA